MKKKIDLFWYWFIFVSAFVLCFFVVNDKKINAYHLDDSGNVVSDNLYMPNSINQTGNNFFGNNVKRYVLSDYGYNIIVSNDNALGSVGFYFNLARFPNVVVGETYTLSFDITSNNSFGYFKVGLEGDNGYVNYCYTKCYFTGVAYDRFNYVIYGYDGDSSIVNNTFGFDNLMLYQGDYDENKAFEPYGVWYNETLVGDLAQGVLGIESATLTYEDEGTGNVVNYGSVKNLLKNSFGFIYFDDVWKMLDSYAIDGYTNAFIDIKFSNRLNITTKYIITTSKDNYGSGVVFYQDDTEMLSVLNLFNVKDKYCGGAPSFSCYVQLNDYVNVVDEGVSSSNAFSYLNRIRVWSDSVDMKTLSFGFENIAYSQGYNSGYNIGYNNGILNGENIGYNNGYGKGYLYGYEKGVEAVQGTDNTLVGMVGSILTAPVNMLQEIFNFEFLGINLTNFIFSILSLFIVIWLIKIFL